jgi:hypothetical protein
MVTAANTKILFFIQRISTFRIMHDAGFNRAML